MLVPLWRQFGSGGADLSGGAVAATPEMVSSHQTRWVIPMRVNQHWVAPFEVKPIRVTPP